MKEEHFLYMNRTTVAGYQRNQRPSHSGVISPGETTAESWDMENVTWHSTARSLSTGQPV